MIDHLSGTTKTLLGHLRVDTLLANLFLGAVLGTLTWEPSWKLVPGYLFLETCPWKPIPASLDWEPVETVLGDVLANLFWVTWLGNLFLDTLLGDLFLEPYYWEPFLENVAWELAVGNLWESLGIFENLFLGTFGTCSWELWQSSGTSPCLEILLGSPRLGSNPTGVMSGENGLA